MLMTKLISKILPLTLAVGVFALSPTQTLSQCGTLLDGDGVETPDPVYFECNDGSGTFQFWPLSNGTWTDLTVDWGDGTAPEFFSEWSDTQAISHHYAYQEHATYTVTFSTASCTATATLKKSVLVNSRRVAHGCLCSGHVELCQRIHQRDSRHGVHVVL